MSVAPEIMNGGGVSDTAALASALSDIQRRIGTLETSRTVIDAGTIQGTGGGGAGHISALSVTTPELAAGSVTAAKLEATLVLATAIVLSGAGYLETSATNPKVRFDSLGVRAITAGGTQFDIRADGRAVMGNPSAARTELDSAGLIGYNSSSVEQVRISATDGKIYVGGTTGARVELDRNGMRAYNSGGSTQLHFNSISGILEVAGTIVANQTGSAIPVTYVTSGNIVSGTIITIDSGGRLQTAPGATTTTTSSHTLPVGTINVVSAASFASAGTVMVGTQVVTYTGKTATTLTGCTGGTGVQVAGTAVFQRHSQVILDAAGVRAYNSTGVETVNLTTAGALQVTDSVGNASYIQGGIIRTAGAGATRVQMVGGTASGGGTNAFEVYNGSTNVLSIDGTSGMVIKQGNSLYNAVSWQTSSVNRGQLLSYITGTQNVVYASVNDSSGNPQGTLVLGDGLTGSAQRYVALATGRQGVGAANTEFRMTNLATNAATLVYDTGASSIGHTLLTTAGAMSLYGALTIGASTAGALKMGSLTVIDASGGWHRVHGNTGFYFETHTGGWQMLDSTYLRSYNNKIIYNSYTSVGMLLDGRLVAGGGASPYDNAVSVACLGHTSLNLDSETTWSPLTITGGDYNSGIRFHAAGNRIDQFRYGRGFGFIIGDTLGYGAVATYTNALWYTTAGVRSDGRFKTGVRDLADEIGESFLARVLRLRPRAWEQDHAIRRAGDTTHSSDGDFRADEQARRPLNEAPTDHGFVAQEVLEAIPEAINAAAPALSGDGTMLAYDATSVLAHTVGAVQELEALVNKLYAKIAVLESKPTKEKK